MITKTSVPQANFFFQHYHLVARSKYWKPQKNDGHSAILHDALNVQLKCCQTIAIERHHARIHGHARKGGEL